MDSIFIIRALFLITLAIPVIIILKYAIILIYYYNKKTPNIQTEVNTNEEVTILIPTHNEAKIIEKRVNNIFELDYPQDKIKVIFIDDSNDTTPQVIQKYVDSNKNIHLIRFEKRMGYSPSIIAGLQATKTDLVILNEAGSFPRPNMIKKILQDFQNPKVGGVTANSVIINTDETIGGVEALYIKVLNFIRKAESNMDSTFYIKGEATAYRTKLLADIEAVPGTGSIDTTMSFLVREKGYKTIYDENLIFDEYAPDDDKDYIKQKTTRAANVIRNIMIFKTMLFNPKYGKFGFITLPVNLIALTVFPFLLILASILTLIGLLIDTTLFTWIAGTAILALALTYLIAKKVITMFLDIEISLLKAIYQIFFVKKGHDKIERVESTRR